MVLFVILASPNEFSLAYAESTKIYFFQEWDTTKISVCSVNFKMIFGVDSVGVEMVSTGLSQRRIVLHIIMTNTIAPKVSTVERSL
jgi:hypothetical protein